MKSSIFPNIHRPIRTIIQNIIHIFGISYKRFSFNLFLFVRHFHHNDIKKGLRQPKSFKYCSTLGERRELNPRVEDPQSTALIHLATSALSTFFPSKIMTPRFEVLRVIIPSSSLFPKNLQFSELRLE